MDLDTDEAAFFATLLDGLRRALNEGNLLDETIPVRRDLVADAIEAITDYITEAP